MHDRITPLYLRDDALAHKTSLAPPLFMGVSVTRQENKRSYILLVCYEHRIYVFLRFLIVFWNCLDRVAFVVFHFSQ
jgi:hypothetical protein